MAYEGGRLAPWFDTGPVDRFCRRAARRGGDHQTALTKRKTPVDTGALRQSIHQKPLRVFVDARGHRVYETGCETDKEYAPPIEYGWGLWGPKHARYEIRPKNPDGWLHWIDPHTGRDVFRKVVHHPGAQGAHMFAIAAAETQGQLDGLVADLLRRWAVETERQNRSDWGLGRGRL